MRTPEELVVYSSSSMIHLMLSIPTSWLIFTYPLYLSRDLAWEEANTNSLADITMSGPGQDQKAFNLKRLQTEPSCEDSMPVSSSTVCDIQE